MFFPIMCRFKASSTSRVCTFVTSKNLHHLAASNIFEVLGSLFWPPVPCLLSTNCELSESNCEKQHLYTTSCPSQLPSYYWKKLYPEPVMGCYITRPSKISSVDFQALLSQIIHFMSSLTTTILRGNFTNMRF